MIIAGVDPGLNGAVGVLRDWQAVRVEDLPTIGGRTDPLAFAELAEALIREYRIDLWVIESPIKMVKQNINTTVKTFEAFGAMRGVLAALRQSVEIVAPSTWKTALSVPGGKDKGPSLARAREQFPHMSGRITLKKHDGRAEALLIAHWRRLKAGGTPTMGHPAAPLPPGTEGW